MLPRFFMTFTGIWRGIFERGIFPQPVFMIFLPNRGKIRK